MAQDAETRTVYQIGFHLGRTVSEVLDMPAEELRGWVAFLAHLSETQK